MPQYFENSVKATFYTVNGHPRCRLLTLRTELLHEKPACSAEVYFRVQGSWRIQIENHILNVAQKATYTIPELGPRLDAPTGDPETVDGVVNASLYVLSRACRINAIQQSVQLRLHNGLDPSDSAQERGRLIEIGNICTNDVAVIVGVALRTVQLNRISQLISKTGDELPDD